MVQSTCWHDLKPIRFYALELEPEAVVLVFPLCFPVYFVCIVVHLNIMTSDNSQGSKYMEVSVSNISLFPNHKRMVLVFIFPLKFFPH